MKRREFMKNTAAQIVALCGAGSLGGGETVAPLPGAKRPNIVLIFADDLGRGELGVQLGRDVPTPRIDSIATNGARFTNGYVTCPVCSPTRAGLLTGRYQQQLGCLWQEIGKIRASLPSTHPAACRTAC